MPRSIVSPTVDARERILRAAEKLFAEKGYAATSVGDIADAAETNRALLYYYFEDKHSLYVSLIDEGVAQFRRMAQVALATPGSYSDRLAAFVRGHLDLIWKRTNMARVVHRCLLDGHQEEVGLVEKFQVVVEELEQFFRDAVAAGEFRPVDPTIAARTFLGPTYIFSLWKLYDRSQFDPEEVAAYITDLLLRGLIQSRSQEDAVG
jgi:TetR/AcrR family transcriptional regulator, cholesterol catabolism regulator